MTLREGIKEEIKWLNPEDKIHVNYCIPYDGLYFDSNLTIDEIMELFSKDMDKDVKEVRLMQDERDVVASYAVDKYPGTCALYDALDYDYDEDHRFDENRKLILMAGEPVTILYIEFYEDEDSSLDLM